MKKIYLGLALLATTASFALAKVNVSAGIAYEGNKTGSITTDGTETRKSELANTVLVNIDVQYFLPILNINNKVLVIAGAGGRVESGVGSLKVDEYNKEFLSYSKLEKNEVVDTEATVGDDVTFIPFSMSAYIEPQVKYVINDDLAVNVGVKGGLGFEIFHYLPTEKADEAVKELKEKNKEITKTGARTVATFIMPASLALGVDYKNLTINLEPTMKFIAPTAKFDNDAKQQRSDRVEQLSDTDLLTNNITKTKTPSKDGEGKTLYTQTGHGKFVFGVGLNIGYSFDIDNIK